jgi:tRNA synthetases class I (W and Y)
VTGAVASSGRRASPAVRVTGVRVLSGIQPSGTLHLGNYFEMMAPVLARQDRDELVVCLVDLHALTSELAPEALARNTVEAALARDPTAVRAILAAGAARARHAAGETLADVEARVGLSSRASR